MTTINEFEQEARRQKVHKLAAAIAEASLALDVPWKKIEGLLKKDDSLWRLAEKVAGVRESSLLTRGMVVMEVRRMLTPEPVEPFTTFSIALPYAKTHPKKHNV